MICENCDKEHDGSYGSGRFCSAKCARGYSTKLKRAEINEKVSSSLKKQSEELSQRASKQWKGIPKSEAHKEALSLSVKKSFEENGSFIKPNSIRELSKRTITKIFKRLKLSCSNCGWDKTVCDVHHIIPKSIGGTDDHSNLTYICPNCHRLAHEKKIESFTNLEDQIGETWKDYYFPIQRSRY